MRGKPDGAEAQGLKDEAWDVDLTRIDGVGLGSNSLKEATHAIDEPGWPDQQGVTDASITASGRRPGYMPVSGWKLAEIPTSQW
jgi:hypothetical protein